MKRCKKCDQLKPTDAFASGRHQCRDCRNADWRERYYGRPASAGTSDDGQTRRCRTCDTRKPLTEFADAKKNKLQKDWTCKECRSAYYRLRMQRPEVRARKAETNRAFYEPRNEMMFQDGPARRAGAKIAEQICRLVVLEMDDGICGICNEPVDEFGKFEIDHIVPLKLGGEHSYANVQIAHPRCNHRKNRNLEIIHG